MEYDNFITYPSRLAGYSSLTFSVEEFCNLWLARGVIISIAMAYLS